MDQNKFSQKDSENLVKLLNFINDNAEFKLKVTGVVEFFGLLAWAQKELKPKLDANILEVLAVREPEPKEEKKPRAGRASKK